MKEDNKIELKERLGLIILFLPGAILLGYANSLYTWNTIVGVFYSILCIFYYVLVIIALISLLNYEDEHLKDLLLKLT